MYIKGRFKLIRKHDCDFWNISYYRAAQNRFFRYFKHSMEYRSKKANKRNRFRFQELTLRLFDLVSKLKRSKGYLSPFLSAVDPKPVKYRKYRIYSKRGYFYNKRKEIYRIKGRLNVYKLFQFRGLKYLTWVYTRRYFRRVKRGGDLLLGLKRRLKRYRPRKLRFVEIRRFYFQQLSLYYNNFDLKKLRRFGKLSRKGRFGGVNYFFFLLESRLDSIVARLNLGCKFIMREVVFSNKVLVDNKPINYPNYIVKKNCFVHFVEKFRRILKCALHFKLPKKMFYVQPPFYLEINYRTFMILIVPKLIDPIFVPYPFLKVKSSLVTGLHTVLWGW